MVHAIDCVFVHLCRQREGRSRRSPGHGGQGLGKVECSDNVHLAQRFLPNKQSGSLDYDARVFCGKFNREGDVFMSATQDQHLRMYRPSDDKEWEPFKEVQCRHVQWCALVLVGAGCFG